MVEGRSTLLSVEEEDQIARSHSNEKAEGELSDTPMGEEIENPIAFVVPKSSGLSSASIDESTTAGDGNKGNTENPDDIQIMNSTGDPPVQPEIEWAPMILSYKEKLMGVNGRDQENQGEEESNDQNETATPMVIEQTSSTHMTVPQVREEPKAKGVKVKAKRNEASSQANKKQIIQTHANSTARKSVKAPQVKAQEHTLVTSQSQGIKNSTSVMSSPSKAKDGMGRKPNKQPQDPSKVKHRKPPDFDE
ncbi:uncharacterized protein G2W53_032601 [Senna tora]|uniref:Uncharacterized protein n=1 Tax=Senna tora TaxID=362788 RepID=A0A834W6G2_9FABA|nr:uncharacterized protein G2W53_032601 [Senna tora]